MAAGAELRIGWSAVPACEVPASDGWLGGAEVARLAQMALPARRASWRLGRWAVKRAILGASAEAEGTRLQVLPAWDGAPQAWLDGRPAGVVISISQRAGLGSCVVTAPGSRLGCDLECVEPREAAFVADWFTAAELAEMWVAPVSRPAAAALLWSAKESVLKAIRTGLREDPRAVDIEAVSGWPGSDGGWTRFAAACRGWRLCGWWRFLGERHVMTAVSEPAAPEPVPAESLRWLEEGCAPWR